MTAVAPGGECPLWHAFLDRVTAGDEALQQYLQRVCGYALTGLTREHALFFFYGNGANGKTTFVRRPSPVSSTTITAPRRSRPSPPRTPTGTRPSLPTCAALG